MGRIIGTSSQPGIGHVITKKSRAYLKTRDAQIRLSQVIDLSLPERARLSTQAQHQARRFQALSKTQQRFLIQMIDLLERAQAKT
jgi:hypothetical protein